jgi:hypothetical protein
VRRPRSPIAFLATAGVIAFSWLVPSGSGAAAAVAAPDLADLSCALTPLPHGVRAASPDSAELSGPAVTALTGGAARHGFSLDDRDLVVDPPGPGDRPVVTAQQALCGAMASTGGLRSYAVDGVAVGYGRVSVAQKFFPALTSFPYPGIVAAQNPTVPSFRDRLAWVVVVHTPAVTSFFCQAESAPVRLVPRVGDHGYEVFLLDARTGGDALDYTEGRPGGCRAGARVPPVVGVAEEQVSVPWTLVSRDPGGYSGTLAATVLPCDKAPSTVLVDPGGNGVEVEVTRPFGPPCGAPETVSIGLHAAVVTADLPDVVVHDPVGLVTGLSPPVPAPPGTPPPTTTTVPALLGVDASSNGHTVDMTVGEVVTVQPLPGAQGLSFTNPVTSTDPAVLGPLTPGAQPPVAEFRAWTAGTAELTVPPSACIHPGSDQVPCNGPFVVDVVVH